MELTGFKVSILGMIFLLTGIEGTKFSSLPEFFKVDGNPVSISVTISDIQKGTIKWLLDGMPFASVKVSLDDSGLPTLSNPQLSNTFAFKFEMDGQNVQTSITIDHMLPSFNETKLTLTDSNDAVSDAAVLVYPEWVYIVTIHTDDDDGDKGNVEILVTIYGDFGKTSSKFVGSLKDFKTAGGRKVTRIKSGNIGTIKKVIVGHRQQENKPTWFLRSLQITDPSTDNAYIFPAKGWLNTSRDEELYPGMSRDTNKLEDECKKPPVGHPDYGIVDKNAIVTRNCTAESGKTENCSLTWTCFANVTCGLVKTECECQGDACGTGYKFGPNFLLIALSFLLATVVKVYEL